MKIDVNIKGYSCEIQCGKGNNTIQYKKFNLDG
jgi:hypothetical protein